MTRPVTLVCFDGSAASRLGLDVAQTLLASTDLIVLTVWQSVASRLAEAGSLGAMAVVAHESADRAAEEEARTAAARGAEIARASGGHAKARVEEGDEFVWKAVLKVADEVDAASIVIGSRGRSPLKGALLGSVSREVLAHTTRPVLVVPPAHAPER
ncbi:universal stress protein [Streptomyces sp. NPDC093228]|uniref:universal stress protein n=1 Tax=unclassified Streptomyces TaxID=2593676 RepID=UPI000E24B5E8|nr:MULTISPECIES: universal stress protein [unclassified Streptomyces]MDX3265882.1 universal stress protein [Streptomyces sp. MI02-2A]REE64020.1 nucleotide-binding universal stress UspA family protein [Streptomyces sp. 3212.3]